MATLLVSALVLLPWLHHCSLGRLNTVPQIFKIIAPFVFLAAAFATLNARLGMPPFALFLIALSLTDGTTTWFPCNQKDSLTNPMLFGGGLAVMTMTFFFNVTDTGEGMVPTCHPRSN